MTRKNQGQSRQHDEALDQIDHLSHLLKLLPKEVTSAQRLASLGLAAAFIAHETRNCLTPILGYTQLARKISKDEKSLHKALDHIESGVGDLAQLANLVLGVVESRDQCARVREVIDLLQKDLVASGRDPCDIKTNAQLDLELRISPSALRHILMNLVMNSYEAGKTGSPVEIQVRSMRNGERASIEVIDHAGGMSREMEGAVFEPLKSSGRGTGLGLSLCKLLVECSGGSIELSTNNGNGTVVAIHLPCKGWTCTTSQAG